MNEPVNPTFASEQVEKTEIERITEQVQNYKASIDGKLVNVVNVLIEQYLKAGLVSTQDLQAISSLSNEFNKAQIDYQTFMTSKQKRIQELQQEEIASASQQREAVYNELHSKMTEERVARKKAEQDLRIAMAQLQALTNIKGNVTSAPAITGGNAPSITGMISEVEAPIPADNPKVETKPVERSRAFDLARALNPENAETLSEDESLIEKVEETKEAFKEWEEEEVKSIDDVTPEEWDRATKSIKEESVEEQLELPIEEETVEEQLELPIEEETVELEDEVKDELDLYEEQLIAEEQEESDAEEFTIQEEDKSTRPNFTTPVVSSSNAPNLKQNIPTYDSEEELLAAAQAKIDAKLKQEAEEEYEEITIPSEAELSSMTKADILKQAEELGFENVSTSDTKKVMIQNFVSDANAFIQSLEESGDLLSTNVEGEEDDTVDRQDGGYF